MRRRQPCGWASLQCWCRWLVLLGLQYRWLRKLDQSSEIVHRATLNSSWRASPSEVELLLQQRRRAGAGPARRGLHPGPARQGGLPFKKKGVEGVQRLFVMSFLNDDGPPLLRAHLRPVRAAATGRPRRGRSGWRRRPGRRSPTRSGERLERVRLIVEEKDPDFRILLYPDHRRLLAPRGPRRHGARRGVLPRHRAARRRSRKRSGRLRFHGDPSVRADRLRPGRPRGGSSTPPSPARKRRASPADETEKPFSFVFTDWKIGLASRHATAGRGGAAELPGQHRPFRRRSPPSSWAGSRWPCARPRAEMKLSQMKNEFVSNVSHELRTPLASIRVFGEFLRLGRVRQPGEGPRVRRLHRDREPAPDPADQQHPRLREHRVGPQDLPLRALRRRARWSARR